MRQPKDGEYYYAPKGRHWAVYQHHELANGTSEGIKISEYTTREKAREEVYKRNGWQCERKSN